MLCKIADLITEVPEAGGMAPRLKGYSWSNRFEDPAAEIVIDEAMYRPNAWSMLSEDDYVYMETGAHFYANLLFHSGLMLHASAIELDGYAYLFSGSCGAGKSTHARLWERVFDGEARVFNDDKPALRRIDGRWLAYGTPWCGKDGININMKAPIAGICFLEKANTNSIRRLSQQEALQKIIWQTPRRFQTSEKLDLMLSHLDKLVREVPVFELENRPEPAAALLSRGTMRRAAEDAGLLG